MKTIEQAKEALTAAVVVEPPVIRGLEDRKRAVGEAVDCLVEAIAARVVELLTPEEVETESHDDDPPSGDDSPSDDDKDQAGRAGQAHKKGKGK